MGPIIFNIFINYLDNRSEVLKPQTGFQVVCCPSEEPQGTREMGWQEPCETQQWECEVLLLGNNPMHQNSQRENWPRKKLCRKCSGSPCEHQAAHELEIYFFCDQEGHRCTGQHWEKLCHHVDGDDPHLLFVVAEKPAVLCLLLALQYQTRHQHTCMSLAKSHKYIKGASNKQQGSLNWLSWRRKSQGLVKRQILSMCIIF